VTKMLLRYVHEFKDRHGKTRRYFRRRGFKRLPLSGPPGSDEFMEAYARAIDPKTAPRIEIGTGRIKPGTVADLIARYCRSTAFVGLSPGAQTAYRGILRRLETEHGDKRVAMLQRQHVKDLLAKKVATPVAANSLLKMLRLLMQVAVDVGMRADDPTISVKRFRIKSDGHPAWTERDIAAFRARHPTGTRARLAMELAFCTMQRRGDLSHMGRQHVQGGVLTIRQQKTGTVVEVPVLSEVQAELDHLPAGQMTFLVTEQGRPFTAAGLGNWFRAMCAEAGLPTGYNTHGLRKAGATRLAEAGCSDHEIMSWGGWTSISEVQRYTRAASRRKMAQAAVLKLRTGTTSGKPD
jgi:integrase